MDVVDIDPSFEPLQRVRSNTWPLPRPENYVDKDDVGGGGAGEGGKGHDGLGGLLPGVGPLPKKNSSRRNAWGNMSYADLITQAIQSSSDKRLTLSQIYDWMVQNVPYFKDKGDSNSSAGWKNSIRHNLSLHNRFMRVQNEGTGKSSWWMINPDAKPGKAARRRATSMETQKYEKRRGRIKKKVEALRNGLLNQTQQLLHQSADATPSPCSSSLSESLDMFSDSPPEMINPGNGNGGFQLSPDFRPRASSNASSCGRLSPIPGLPDTDLNDSQVPPLSPIPWESDSLSLPQLHPVHVDGNVMVASLYGPDQLVDTLSETMKLDGCSSSTPRNGGNDASGQRQLSPLHVQGVNGRATHLLSLLPSSTSPHSSPNSFGNLHYSNGMNASPQSMNGTGRYQDYSSNNTPSNVYQGGRNDMVKLSPQHLLVASDNNNSFGNISSLQAALSPSHSVHSLSPPGESGEVASASTPPHSSQGPQPQQPSQPSLHRSLESLAVLSPLNNSAYSCSSPGGGGGRGYRALTITSARNGVNGGECNGVTRNVMLNESHCGAGNEPALLRAALTPKALLLSSHSQAQGMAANSRDVLENLLMGQAGHGLGGMECGNDEDDDEDQFSTTSVSQMMGQLIAMPNDLDLNLEGGLECDVDQVINHELSHGGNLDFNFAESHASAAAAAAAAASHGRHWIVH